MEKINILSKDIIPISGYLRSNLLDLTRENFHFVPNHVFNFLKDHKIDSIDLKTKEWMLQNDFILSIPKHLVENFLELKNEWLYPSIILTSTIDSRIFSNYRVEHFIEIIEAFNIKSIVINFTNEIQLKNEDLECFLSSLNFSRLNVIEVLLKYSDLIDLELLLNKFSKLKNIIVYESPNIISKKSGEDKLANLCFFKHKFEDRKQNTQNIGYFNVNTELYTESLKYHSYFNRRIDIGLNGEIKNAPECIETFGNINDIKTPDDLKQIVSTPEFQKYWLVKKDETDVCRDCEFRYMCVDNRLPYGRNQNEWFHKIECNYNPYIAKWEGEEGYRNLAACGVISNDNGFSIDHEKIAEINKELWGEDDVNV